MKDILVTREFNLNEMIGVLELTDEGKKLFRKDMVLAPGYIEQEDGSIKLVEISLIPAWRAVRPKEEVALGQ